MAGGVVPGRAILAGGIVPGVLLLWAASHFELFVLEPGYYEDGAFGIRIENVVLVVPAKTKVSVHVCFKISYCYYGDTNAVEPWWGQNGASFPPHRDFTRCFFSL